MIEQHQIAALDANQDPEPGEQSFLRDSIETAHVGDQKSLLRKPMLAAGISIRSRLAEIRIEPHEEIGLVSAVQNKKKALRPIRPIDSSPYGAVNNLPHQLPLVPLDPHGRGTEAQWEPGGVPLVSSPCPSRLDDSRT